MLKSLIISILLLTFLIQESDLNIAPVTEVSSEIELVEVAEKIISQHKIQFKKTIKQFCPSNESHQTDFEIANETVSSQIISPSVRKNILLMQFII